MRRNLDRSHSGEYSCRHGALEREVATVLRRIFSMSLVAVTTCACFLVAAPSASASLISVKLGTSASYEANGAGVILPVDLLCGQGDTFQISGSLVQRVPKTSFVVSASGFRELPCSGRAQRLFVPFSSYAPLRLGSAYVSLTASTCGPASCGEDRQILSGVVHVEMIDFPSEGVHAAGLSLKLSPVATRLVRGAALRVTAYARCRKTVVTPGATSAASTQVNVSGFVIEASQEGQQLVPCDGAYHSVAVVISASGYAWHKGLALVDFGLFGCNQSTGSCYLVRAADTVTVT